MPTQSKRATAAKGDGKWMRPTLAAREIGLPRSTMTYRVMRGDFKTKVVAGVLLVWIDAAAREATRLARAS